MAKTIRELRQERGWIQFELAVKLGLQPGTIANWERGRTLPRVTELKRLAQLFGVCMEEIVLPGMRGRIERRADAPRRGL